MSLIACACKISEGCTRNIVDEDINRNVLVADGENANGATTGQLECSKMLRAWLVVCEEARRSAARKAGVANFPPKDMTNDCFCSATRRIATTRVKLHFVENGRNVFID